MRERIMMPFEDWKRMLVGKMEKFRLDEDDLRVQAEENSDVPEFLRELDAFIQNSREKDLIVK